MKKILIFPAILLLGTISLFQSCTKLDETVYDQVLDQNFKPTPGDIPSIIAPVYTVLRSMEADWYGNFDLQEEPGDAIVTPARPNGWYDGGVYQRMHFHEWNQTQGQPNQLWSRCYQGINTANRVIFQIESGIVPITEGKENVIAELKAARAFYYYNLLDNHGNVPIVTNFEDASLPKQSTRKEVYDFVVKELTENIPLLSDKADKTTYGRFNRWAAKAILAKVYLNASIYAGVSEWDKCLKECNDIIDASAGRYVLESSYKTPFLTDNQNSRELVFAVPYDEIQGAGMIIHMKTLDPVMQKVYKMSAQPWGGNCAVPQFIDTYDPEDTRLKDTWIQGPQYDANTGAMLISYTKQVDGIALAGSNQGYRIGKYEIKMGSRGSLSTDFPIIRYADVLMMKAESLLRTGDANGAATLVTEVRKRAFANTNPSKAIVSGADLIKGSAYKYGIWSNGAVTEYQGGDDIQYGRFLDELGWEFAAEGHRRQDMIRFGIYTTKKWFNHKSSADYKIIFPIPENEMSKNANLKQNPGYN